MKLHSCVVNRNDRLTTNNNDIIIIIHIRTGFIFAKSWVWHLKTEVHFELISIDINFNNMSKYCEMICCATFCLFSAKFRKEFYWFPAKFFIWTAYTIHIGRSECVQETSGIVRDLSKYLHKCQPFSAFN